jgi:uncharacterized protein YndB with AHSA1/START domain
MDDDAVRIVTNFNTTREKVWEAWTESEFILQWFGSDPNGKGLNAKMNVEQGGSYEITLKMKMELSIHAWVSTLS